MYYPWAHIVIISILVGACTNPVYDNPLGKRVGVPNDVRSGCTQNQPCVSRSGDFEIRYYTRKLDERRYQIEGHIKRIPKDSSIAGKGEIVVYSLRQGVVAEYDTFWVPGIHDNPFSGEVQFEQSSAYIIPVLGHHVIGGL